MPQFNQKKYILNYIDALHHQLTIAKENSQLKIKIVVKYVDLHEKNLLSLR